MKTGKSFTAVLIVAFLFGLYSMPAIAKHPKGLKTKPIVLKVKDPDGANPELDIQTGALMRGCSGGSSKNGCIGVEQAYAADLLFELKNPKECAEGDTWELSGVQIGGYGIGVKEDVTWGRSIPAEVASDFSANAANGDVPFVFIDEDTIRIHDKNASKYDIWYRIKASCNSKDIYSDPQIRNSGK